ncbi:RNA 2',3'-cyclic phosphodiesterase [Streptomyces meridianus]|uniref:RNA 2',3'-cyclic phosphodiesterase n=1 Tax=Streptomyces meridianus TaxID=2938945 RepID=A0ABT0X2T1_9ACTN|nr:RNA 2',3'-cyclic phosphodiesterase [Streptomyces meridianus]MCM2576850.1 RNA 2',3'-cyclic phosphodiesterase [Streptomyces meridianus]
MRLFAAVLPPQAALAELAGAVARLRSLPGADRLRWTGHPGWHFTLAFYGEVGDDLVPALNTRLERVARRHRPFDLRLAGGGRFARAVVWVGAEGDREAMRGLARSAAAAARREGIPMDEHRPYAPHLTVARNRTHLGLAPFVEELADFAGTWWSVERLCLVRSHPPAGGVPGEQPRYETIGAWPLGR